MKSRFLILSLGILSIILISSCYSFTGATIEGKSINIVTVENKSLNIVPTLAPTLNEKLRGRILSQTGLSPISNDEADYTIIPIITNYAVNISGVSGGSGVAQNRLSITLNVDFKNKINPKANFKSSFTRFRDFDGNTQLQSVESALINEISEELADDVFNRAFVNW